jgi:hypothetical protein
MGQGELVAMLWGVESAGGHAWLLRYCLGGGVNLGLSTAMTRRKLC